MALRALPRIACSLDVGNGAYVYNFSYSYAPQEGVTMTLFFVNESGVYNTTGILSASTPVSITLDGRAFNMYAIKRTLDRSSDRRVLKVEFVDETFQLENYYVVLTGQGCGPRIFPLGVEVDNRTPQQIFDEESDPRLNNEFSLMIKKLTRFEDVEYKFEDLIGVLSQVFAVECTATYDPEVTRGFPGSFREVLDAWCSYFNLGYYFENNVLKIVNPESLNLTFPSVPSDALDESDTESLEGTFTKTAYAYFRQEGGEKEVAGAQIDKRVELYPMGAELAIAPPAIDLQQVAAAMYGQEYWFLWNWLNGTAEEECGWSWIDRGELPSNLNITTTVFAIGEICASLDSDKFAAKYEMYRTYGERIAGRYYISRTRSSILEDKQCAWFMSLEAAISPYASLQNPVDVTFFQEGPANGGIIAGSNINEYFTGIPANDNRIVYYDQREVDLLTPFTMTDQQKYEVSKAYSALVQGVFGSNALDFSEISTTKQFIVAVPPLNLAQRIPAITPDQLALFRPQYSSFSVRGFLQTVGRSIYYDKLEVCENRSSVEEAHQCMRHILVPRQLSEDIPVIFTVSSPTPNSFVLSRDLSFVDDYLKTELLDKLALPQLQKLRTLTFSLNHLSPDILLTDFVTMGLTGLSIDVAEQGMTVTYTFSNAVQKVPVSEAFLDKLERNIKNSWVSKYRPIDPIN